MSATTITFNTTPFDILKPRLYPQNDMRGFPWVLIPNSVAKGCVSCAAQLCTLVTATFYNVIDIWGRRLQYYLSDAWKVLLASSKHVCVASDRNAFHIFQKELWAHKYFPCWGQLSSRTAAFSVGGNIFLPAFWSVKCELIKLPF